MTKTEGEVVAYQSASDGMWQDTIPEGVPIIRRGGALWTFVRPQPAVTEEQVDEAMEVIDAAMSTIATDWPSRATVRAALEAAAATPTGEEPMTDAERRIRETIEGKGAMKVMSAEARLIHIARLLDTEYVPTEKIPGWKPPAVTDLPALETWHWCHQVCHPVNDGPVWDHGRAIGICPGPHFRLHLGEELDDTEPA